MDCLEGMKQLDDNSVDLILTDPPYNIGKDYNNDSDNQTNEDYQFFIREILKEIIRILKYRGSIFIFSYWRTVNHWHKEAINCELYPRDWIIWRRDNVTQCSSEFLKNLYEIILFYTKEPTSLDKRKFGRYIKNKRLVKNLSLQQIGELCGKEWYYRGGHLYFETGIAIPTVKEYIELKKVLELDNRFDSVFMGKRTFNIDTIRVKHANPDKRNHPLGSNVGNIWKINGIIGNASERVNHPTQKPIELIRRIVKMSSNKEDIIVDPFMGSGTTAVACKQLNRNFIGFEINPTYVEIANKRLQQETLLNLK